MLTVNEVTEIFYLSDEFSKEFDVTQKHFLKEDNGKKHRNKCRDLNIKEGAMHKLIKNPTNSQ